MRTERCRRAAHLSVLARGQTLKATSVPNQYDGEKLGKSQVSAAAAVGLSHDTYYRVRKVVEAAEADPEQFGDLADEMNETGKVDRQGPCGPAGTPGRHGCRGWWHRPCRALQARGLGAGIRLVTVITTLTWVPTSRCWSWWPSCAGTSAPSR